MDYLLRVTEQAPDAVSSVLLTLTTVENAWIRRGIVEAAAKLPAEMADALTGTIARWAKNRSFSAMINPNDVAALVTNLCAVGLPSGVKVAEAFYRPRQSSEEAKFGRSEVTIGVDDHSYAATLPTVAMALGADAVDKLKYWLEDYQIHSNSFRRGRRDDSSTVWRPRVSSVLTRSVTL
jgi:hypothetical protein